MRRQIPILVRELEADADSGDAALARKRFCGNVDAPSPASHYAGLRSRASLIAVSSSDPLKGFLNRR